MAGKSPRLITPKTIATAVKAQGIDTPYWTRVVGNRLEIQPLGGQVIVIPFGPSAKRPGVGNDRPKGLLTAAELRAMKRDELRALAREKEIEGAGTMLKAELVNALYEAKS